MFVWPHGSISQARSHKWWTLPYNGMQSKLETRPFHQISDISYSLPVLMKVIFHILALYFRKQDVMKCLSVDWDAACVPIGLFLPPTLAEEVILSVASVCLSVRPSVLLSVLVSEKVVQGQGHGVMVKIKVVGQGHRSRSKLYGEFCTPSHREVRHSGIFILLKV